MNEAIYFPRIMRQDLSRQLKTIRQIIGLSGKEVAADLGIDPGTLTKIEHASFNYGVDTLIRLADYYGWTVQIVLDAKTQEL